MKFKSQEATRKQERANRHETGDVSDDDTTSAPQHARERALSVEDVDDDDDDAADDTSQTTPRTCPMRRSGSLRDDRLLYMSRYQNEFRTDDDGLPAPPRMPVDDGYHPTLSGATGARRDEHEPKHQRRIKLGTKAADLFAKLEMRLSNKK